MEKIVKLKYLRIAPRKVRLIADLVRGKSFESAQNLLNFAIKRGSQDLLRLLRSAAAALPGADKENLYIKKIFVDEGPKYKRWLPRARGQAFEIQKKTSHVTIVLEELEAEAKEEKETLKVSKGGEAPAPSAKTEGTAKIAKAEKPHFVPKAGAKKPKGQKSFKRFFRRKAI